ncbi:MAG: hypothetical protein DLM53_02010 [Candidatus Eremiobacter antarcticus]|nr:hypothetical protein [Candidatus Eremiobacteraeota bacterium]MBC5808181.1 hypothetical protein [Candidatus Eremiobacteraeota bacterium]PZR63575.1 MAG: hypothetical protein DLM53_02010 [Candidatus Eremiobacter sp. RRmetagenome_bin22]
MNGYGSRGSTPGQGRGFRPRGGVGRRPYPQDAQEAQAARPRKLSCPPELRDAFVEARDFLAGLIAALGLPARLGFGGVDPARDGRQITIEVRSLADAPDRPDERGPDGRQEPGDLAILIGKHGATLDALSALTNAFMHRNNSRDLFFSVDVEGYRARRVATLRSIAQRCATRVLREGIALELEPMPPSERRIIHLSLAANADLQTESIGVGSQRRIVIMPRDSAPPVEPLEDFE